jgi:hypothetical protein
VAGEIERGKGAKERGRACWWFRTITHALALPSRATPKPVRIDKHVPVCMFVYLYILYKISHTHTHTHTHTHIMRVYIYVSCARTLA